MKKYICLFLSFCIWISISFTVQANTQRFCVMSQDGRILYGNNLHEVQSVASISKVMTAIVAMEHGDLAQKITIGKEILSAQGSSIYLKVGETYSLQDLLYGLLLRSGNDAAKSIAVALAKDEETFVEWMNAKAQQLGMKDTVFRNPSGLDEEDGGNLSSVYDMALLMKYAMTDPTFAKITAAKRYVNEKGIQWINKNKLLTQYPYAISGKTGYTKKAGRTLISCAKKEGLQVVIVTFQMSDDFSFHQQYYEKVFSSYSFLPLIAKGTYHVNGKSFYVEQEQGITLRSHADYQVKEYCDKQGYHMEANSDEHTVAYTYLWR